MKRCPVCQRSYTDQAINFCLADGALLKSDATAAPEARRTSPGLQASEAPTEAMRQEAVPTLVTPPPQFPPRHIAPPMSPQRSGGGKSILWFLAGLLLAGGVAVLVYFLTQRSSGGTSSNEVRSSTASNSSTTNTANYPVNVSVSSTPAATPFPTATATPVYTPTPTPTPNAAAARSEVTTLMDTWAETLRRQDLSGNLRLYADYLDEYYGPRGASREQVRANRQAIFNKYYSSTNVQLSNISVEIDSTGTRATVFYDNYYNWRGGAKYLTGKSRNKMILSKVGSQWLITSETHQQQLVPESGN